MFFLIVLYDIVVVDWYVIGEFLCDVDELIVFVFDDVVILDWDGVFDFC